VRERANNRNVAIVPKRNERDIYFPPIPRRIDGNSVAPARASNLRGNPPLIFPVAVSRSANNFIVTADAKRLKELPGPAMGLLPSHPEGLGSSYAICIIRISPGGRRNEIVGIRECRSMNEEKRQREQMLLHCRAI